jgi:hypothetical protein
MGKIVAHNHRASQRRRVAQEAAELLYTGQEKEYKQAKLRAVETLGIRVLPSNAEIAIRLDQIAEEKEGKARQEKLVQMRCEALQIMQVLENFNPTLVGSVWRGTAHHNSDIDIVVYAENPQQIVSLLKGNYTVTKSKVRMVTKKGEKEQSFHVYLSLPSGSQAEIVVRSPENINRRVKCEVFGDIITGLTIERLQEVLAENQQQRFLPT